MFDQHYLANMFAKENSEFLNTVVRVDDSVAIARAAQGIEEEELGTTNPMSGQTEGAVGKTVGELSRLSLYMVGVFVDLVMSGEGRLMI